MRSRHKAATLYQKTALLLLTASAVGCPAARAAETTPVKAPPFTLETRNDLSLRLEVQHAIDKGLSWLEKNQNTNGCWSSPDHPALTGLALSAFKLRSVGDQAKAESAVVRAGYGYLISCVQPDGGIYRRDLPSYNTSVCLMALAVANRPEFTPTILKARKFIIGLQVDLGEPGKIDTASDGGIGYGNQDRRPDLSNSSWAYEAVRLTKSFVTDKNAPEAADLNWAAAIHFIQSCQNLPSHNPEKWASDDPQNKGGFVYMPGKSVAGETNLASGRVALRSYGSMTYAGLLSYVYADLKIDDPRVTAAVDWLRANFSLDENPGLGPQGLYYYYLVMAKSLALYGADSFELKEGRTIRWREELALKLINLQRADGAWANENGRWWEKDPVLATAFALLALEVSYKQI